MLSVAPMIVLCVAASVYAAAPDLAPRFAAGEGSKFAFTERMSQSNYGKDQDTPATVKNATNQFEFTLSCVSFDPAKGGEFKLVYDAVKVSVDTPMGPMEYDSSAPPKEGDPSPLAPVYGALVGVPIKLAVSAEGRIVSASPEKPMPPAGARVLSRYTDARALDMTLRPVFGLKPRTVEAAATSWEVEDEVALAPGKTQKLRRSIAVEGVKDAQATLVSTSATDLPDPTGGMLKNAKVRSEERGTHVWDTAAGRLLRSERTETTTLTGEIAEGPVKSVTKKTELLERKP